MLDQILKYAQNAGISSEPGFSTKTVRWLLTFDQNGTYTGFIELGQVNDKKNKGEVFELCPNLTQPELGFGSSQELSKCHFLVETAGVVVLLSEKGEEPIEKIKRKHDYFAKLLFEASESVPFLNNIAQALSDPIILKAMQKELEAHKAKHSDNVTIGINNIPVVSCRDANELRPLWEDWWRAHYRELKKLQAGQEKDDSSQCQMVDVITGEIVEPIRSHEKIKGLVSVGGLGTGDSMVSFDKDAYRSFGLEQSLNAAMSAETVSAYATALNKLISDKNQSKRLVGTIMTYWYDKSIGKEDDPMEFLCPQKEQADEEILGMDNTPEEIQAPKKKKVKTKEYLERDEKSAIQTLKKLLDSIEENPQKKSYSMNAYYHAIILSGVSGRVMMRDYIFASYEEIARNILQWFEDVGIRHRQKLREPTMWNIICSIERDPKPKDAPKPLEAKLWRCAVKKETIPREALAKAVHRSTVYFMSEKNKSNNNEDWNQATRMGLIKAYHVRKQRKPGGEKLNLDSLNEGNPSVAYQCGRLLSILADLQYAALGDVGAGVIDRFYASASSTPALILGRLTRTSQYHLAKLDPGLARIYDAKIAKVWSKIGNSVPKTFNLEDQSLFALGYYQQKESDIEERIKASNEKKANITKEGNNGNK